MSIKNVTAQIEAHQKKVARVSEWAGPKTLLMKAILALREARADWDRPGGASGETEDFKIAYSAWATAEVELTDALGVVIANEHARAIAPAEPVVKSIAKQTA
ncbi:hypothetical protein SBC1_31370 [Caballeronia sp. SBC1]|uniref:hypothetical protein n=1 Tax=Caballeronia sp. SBC1 TaxID=2705548 RepID=UPI00140859C8|nr:hypothetical protein [Caballeronia sp. SBC1]QIN63113.1 hypothetical protein SBC1_31370 [Caballeronia sp. SBC1]